MVRATIMLIVIIVGTVMIKVIIKKQMYLMFWLLPFPLILLFSQVWIEKVKGEDNQMKGVYYPYQHFLIESYKQIIAMSYL